MSATTLIPGGMQEATRKAEAKGAEDLGEAAASAAEAAAKAAADLEQLAAAKQAVEARNAELCAQVAMAGGAIRAAEELREARCGRAAGSGAPEPLLLLAAE
jgi:hypothetical protein